MSGPGSNDALGVFGSLVHRPQHYSDPTGRPLRESSGGAGRRGRNLQTGNRFGNFLIKQQIYGRQLGSQGSREEGAQRESQLIGLHGFRWMMRPPLAI